MIVVIIVVAEVGTVVVEQQRREREQEQDEGTVGLWASGACDCGKGGRARLRIAVFGAEADSSL